MPVRATQLGTASRGGAGASGCGRADLAWERTQPGKHQLLHEGYQSIPSLTDYVLVSQRLAHFAREVNGTWTYRVVGQGARLELTDGTVLVVDRSL